jgi:Holliday junction resolvasome RuvABC endonuclease subunit
MDKYIWGLDLSMSNSGVAILDGCKPVFIGSIPTKDKDTHGVRLKYIYDYLDALKDKYPPEVVCIERGFSRYNTSTAVLYRVHGCVNMLFYDVKQIYYPPKKVKEAIVKGTAKKEEIMNKILEWFPYLDFHCDDESDALAVALTYLIKERGESIAYNQAQ